jgi:hypothetical protein
MREIGKIVRLQIQTASLKVGERPRRYDPAPIQAVPELALAPEGVFAVDDAGRVTLDVHNAEHPASKNRMDNGVSLGFTSHYLTMRERFGDHLADGIAGENILIATDRAFAEAELTAGVVIVGEDGRRIALRDVIVAAPCVEFSRFALRFPDDARPDATVTDALKFLHNGTRGFYASYEGEPAVVRVGDRVCLG